MRWAFVLLALTSQWPAYAVPPPPVQVTAECNSPTYASDQLVCEDAGLLALDGLLAKQIAARDDSVDPSAAEADDQEWFSRSRQCAFEAEHRHCLVAAYCLRLALKGDYDSAVQALCNPSADNYQSSSSLSESGFLRPGLDVAGMEGQAVHIWGFVDQGNVYGDDSAKAILAQWWSGQGPSADSWRFNLKASATAPVGESFAVHIPNDLLRDDLLEAFVSDAREGRATKVFLQGKLILFDAPTGARTFTGLRLELDSTWAVHLERPAQP